MVETSVERSLMVETSVELILQVIETRYSVEFSLKVEI